MALSKLRFNSSAAVEACYKLGTMEDCVLRLLKELSASLIAA